MASIDDVGIDVDFGFEDQVHVESNDTCAEIKEEPQTILPAVKEDSFREPNPNEFSPSENTMQPEDSSSESSFDLEAPVGGSIAAKGNDDDDEEFDFVVTKKETPEIRIEISEEKSVEIVSNDHPSEETPPAPSIETLQQNGVIEQSSPQTNGEINDVKGDGPELNDSSPIQWKTAQKEWNDVKDVQLESDDEEDDERVTSSNTPVISSQEAFNFLKNNDNVLSLYRNQIVTTVQRSGFQALIHTLFGPPRLKRHLIQERDVVFSMALHPYNSNDGTHFRMLLSVYKSLTGNNLDCPKFGGHWDEIGFQGDDPGTDFRGTGMLGLLCLLNLSCPKAEVGVAGDVGRDERTRVLHQVSLSLHRLSRDPEQNFPLAIMSINWTRLLLQTLREGCLNKALNASCTARGMQFSEAFLELHAALAFKFLGIWQREHKTILDSGLVLRDLEELLRKNAAGLLKEWAAHLAGHSPGAAAAAGPAAAPQSRSGQNKKRGERYAVGGTAGPDDPKDEGVAELSMLN